MKKRQLLLEAAAIVEKVKPDKFCMSNLASCALAHIERRENFKGLRRALAKRVDEHFLTVTARFFGIAYAEADHLFGGAESRTPVQEAELLRLAAAKPERKRKAKTPAGMKAIARAISEATSVPAPRQRRTRV